MFNFEFFGQTPGKFVGRQMMIQIFLEIFDKISYKLLSDFVVNDAAAEKLNDDAFFKMQIGDDRGRNLIFFVVKISLPDRKKDLVYFVAGKLAVFQICNCDCAKMLLVYYVKIHTIPPFGCNLQRFCPLHFW